MNIWIDLNQSALFMHESSWRHYWVVSTKIAKSLVDKCFKDALKGSELRDDGDIPCISLLLDIAADSNTLNNENIDYFDLFNHIKEIEGDFDKNISICFHSGTESDLEPFRHFIVTNNWTEI